MSQPIFFSSCIGSQESLLEYQDTIEQILEGRLTRGLHFEKLYGADVYSARINQKGRLLFTRQDIDGEQALIFLMALPNHDYPTQAELQRLEALGFQIAENRFEDADIGIIESTSNAQAGSSSDKPASSSTGYELVDLMVYDRRLINFTLEQEVILQKPLPVVIQGAAGSGKTCVAVKVMSSLKDAVESGQQVLYVAPTKELAESVREIAHASLGELSEQISFQSIDELMSGFYSADFDAVGYDAFASWYQDYAKANRRDLPKDLIAKLSSAKLKSLYEEFQVISGYEVESDYLSLGQKQSLYDEQIRPLLRQAYVAYQTHLEENAQYDKWFVSKSILPADDNPPVVIVDEAQNFSLGSLNLLQTLSANQVCLLMDSNQQVGTVSRYEYAQTHLNIESECLTANFRCPPQVMDFASTVLDLKKKLFKKQKIEAVQSRAASATEGFVRLLSKSEETDEMRRVFELAKTPQLAVIAPAHLVDEARERFDTELVLTPEQAAGLQYSYVMLYEPYMTDSFRKMNKHLQSGQEMAQVDSVAVESALKMHYVAVTRAQKGLWVCGKPSQHHTKHIYQALGLKSQKLEQKAQQHAVQQIESKPLSKKDWAKELNTQIDKGNVDVAERIFNKHIRQEGLIFNEYVDSLKTAQDMKNVARQNKAKPKKKQLSKIAHIEEAKKIKVTGKQPAEREQQISESSTEKRFSKKAKKAVKKLLKQFTAKNVQKFLKSGHGDLLFEFRPDDSGQYLLEKITTMPGELGILMAEIKSYNKKEQGKFLTEKKLLQQSSHGRSFLGLILDSFSYFPQIIIDLRPQDFLSLAIFLEEVKEEHSNVYLNSPSGMAMLLEMASRVGDNSLNSLHLKKLLLAFRNKTKKFFNEKGLVLEILSQKSEYSTFCDALRSMTDPLPDKVELNIKHILISCSWLLPWLFFINQDEHEHSMFTDLLSVTPQLDEEDIAYVLEKAFEACVVRGDHTHGNNNLLIKLLDICFLNFGGQALSRAMTIPIQNSQENYSLLMSLYYFKLTEGIIDHVFELIVPYLTLEDLIYPCTIALDNNVCVQNRTVLQELAEHDQEKLLVISKKNPDLFNNLNWQMLLSHSLIEQTEQPNALLFLSASIPGCLFLSQIFTPKFIRQIGFDDLFEHCLTVGPSIGLSPFILLCRHNIGQQILLSILLEQRNILDNLTWHQMSHKYHDGAPPFMDICLIGDNNLIHLIFNSHEEFYEHFTAETLYSTQYEVFFGEEKYSTSCFTALCQTLIKCNFLLKLFSRNTDLVFGCTYEVLFDEYRLRGRQYSAFTLLCNHGESGHAILRQILMSNYELLNRVVMNYLEEHRDFLNKLNSSDEGALIIDMLESQANHVIPAETAMHNESRFFKPIRPETPVLNIENDQESISQDSHRPE